MSHVGPRAEVLFAEIQLQSEGENVFLICSRSNILSMTIDKQRRISFICMSELRSTASSFDPSRMQELDQKLGPQKIFTALDCPCGPCVSMMPMMGITTLMISQIPEHVDAESFRPPKSR